MIVEEGLHGREGKQSISIDFASDRNARQSIDIIDFLSGLTDHGGSYVIMIVDGMPSQEGQQAFQIDRYYRFLSDLID